LAYLVFAGLIPFISELRMLTRGHASNPYHNWELAGGLMNIAAAFAGIAIALWYLRYSSIFATSVVVLLTLQILFPLLEYRREGFDPRLAMSLGWSGYTMAMLVLALPFSIVWYVIRRRRPTI
jgi:hypothetical protein